MAVAPDTVEELLKMRETIGDEVGAVRFLSDPGGKIIRAYGLLNEKAPSRNLPHPTTVVLDEQGRVRWRFTEVNYRIRPSNQDVKGALERAGLDLRPVAQ